MNVSFTIIKLDSEKEQLHIQVSCDDFKAQGSENHRMLLINLKELATEDDFITSIHDRCSLFAKNIILQESTTRTKNLSVNIKDLLNIEFYSEYQKITQEEYIETQILAKSNKTTQTILKNDQYFKLL